MRRRARNPATERRLRTLAAVAEGEVEVDAAVAERMVRPLRVLLGAVGDGVKLTAAGYLAPAVVQTVFDELDLGDERLREEATGSPWVDAIAKRLARELRAG